MNNKQPFKVLNTRPEPMGRELQQLLYQADIDSIYQPALTTVPTDTTSFSEQIYQGSANHHWLFVSKPAVRYFANSVDGSFQPNGKVFAIGESTKQQLLSYFPQLTVLTPEQANSESFVEWQTAKSLSNKDTLHLCKGQGGRELIQQTLQAQGVNVIEHLLYEKQSLVYQQAGDTWSQCKLIIATSVDICRAMFTSIKVEQLTNSSWLVISERIKQFLVDQGVEQKQIIVCEHADNSSIIKAVRKLAQ